VGSMEARVVTPVSRDQPRIAVVIPLFNGARYIRLAIESALNQSLSPAQIIVVDDGSTDNGTRIVERLARDHPITLLRKRNGGQGSARNHGIANCTSEFIALLDQDDVWYRDHLAALTEPFHQPRAGQLGWVYSDVDDVDEQGNLVACSALRRLHEVPHPKRSLENCLAADMHVLPSASLIAREAFVSVGGFDERLRGYEDDDLFLRIFRAGYENEFVGTALSQRRIHAGSSSHAPAMAVSRMQYLRKLLAAFPDDPATRKYWQRDVLLPRFLPHLLAEYIKARQRHDKELVRLSLENLRFASRYHNRRTRMLVRLLVPLLRLPGMPTTLRAARQTLLPLARHAPG
jgi:glycosyltransferase involved in cell wall biosynthesis